MLRRFRRIKRGEQNDTPKALRDPRDQPPGPALVLVLVVDLVLILVYVKFGTGGERGKKGRRERASEKNGIVKDWVLEQEIFCGL